MTSTPHGRGRGHRAIGIGVTMTLVLNSLAAAPATAAVATFGDGTELEVTIESPADGSSPVDGRVILEGTARVGAGSTPADTSLVVVYDLSGSTLDPAGGNCGGDVNGDGRSNTILDCEVAAMIELERAADGLGSVAEMGVTLFELGAAAADVQPGAGVQRITVPGADLNNNGTSDITEVIKTSRWTSGFFSADATVSLFTRFDAGTGNGGTNYSAGLSNACSTLAATSQPRRIIVFLSDGGANRGSNINTVLPCSQPATVYTFAVGAGATCTLNPSGLGSLQQIADRTGGSCTRVISPSDLPDIISGSIAPEIYRLGLSINGGPEVDISSSSSDPLPATGPDPLDWSVPVEGLAGPQDEVCVTAYARRDTELVQTTECITLVSDRPPIADAGPDQVVDEGSVVALDGSASIDPDGDPLTYLWELTGQTGAPIVLSSADAARAAFLAFDDGVYELRLTVSDGRTEVSDTVDVTVANLAPGVRAEAEPAAEGGVALVTASFTDAGLLDSHSATIDWGDGSGPEPVEISAQGNGWGSLFGTHVYAAPGSFTATVTVTDDDGGIAQAAAVSVNVRPSLAIWANSRTALRTLNWGGGAGVIDGLVHSNNDIRARGESKTFAGPVEFVSSISTSNAVVLSQPPTRVAASEFPVRFDIADYRPAGRAAVDAGVTYHDMTSSCGARWDPVGPLQPGLYYVPCDVKLNSSALTGAVTIAAEGTIQVSGSLADFEPFVDGLLFISNSVADKAIQVSSSDSTYLGYLFAGRGRLDLAGSGNTYLCGLLADRVDITDDRLSIRASDCVRPARTAAAPSLVPELTVSVDVSPADVIPGDAVDTVTTLTNGGSLLLVPGVVGVENLGANPVSVSGIDLGVEYLPVGGTWTRIAEPVTLAARPNASPGVTYPVSGDPVVGTSVGPGALATWGAELQVRLPAATVELLLDPARVTAVRNVLEFTLDNPTSEPVRRLFRFGTDFSPDLRGLGGGLTDVRVIGTATDGSTAITTSAQQPALGALAPGQSVTITMPATVPVPAGRGVIEPQTSYRLRLAALDETELVGGAFAIGAGGVGSVLGAFDSDQATRHVPIAGVDLTGPDAVVAGDLARYSLTLRNTGSATATEVATSAAVAGSSVTIADAPSNLGAGAVTTTPFAYSVPITTGVGTIDAEVSTTWRDANGNSYGAIDDELSTAVGSAPNLNALLADSVLVDADGSGLPSPGDTIRYALTITNRGTTPASGVTVSVPVDPSSELLVGSVFTSAGSVTSGNGVGDDSIAVAIGTISGVSSAEVRFDVLIPDPVPNTSPQLSVQGTVASSAVSGVLTDDPAEPGIADPTITRIVDTPARLQAILAARLATDADGDGLIGPGDDIEYVAQLTNIGVNTAGAVGFEVVPDANTSLVAGSVSIPGGTVLEGNEAGDASVAVLVGDLAGLSEATITYRVRVRTPVPPGVDRVVSQGTATATGLADELTDDPSQPGTHDPTSLPVVRVTGGSTGGGGGGSGGPAATIGEITPADGAITTAPVDIATSVTPLPGTTLVGWEVMAYPANGAPADGIVLASGAGEPPTPIATFDPTVVSNGTWIVRVRITDSAGGVAVSESSLVVEGNLKLGRYAVTYEDASVTVGGIPIRVLRTYDTLNRSEQGDFGYGWTLDVANFDVSTNRRLGEGPWTVESCGGGLIFVPLCFSTDTPRLVTVRWPDGRVESFELKPTGNSFFRIFMSAKYVGRPGTTSTLLPAPGDETGGLGADGNMHAEAFGFGDIYDPQRFVLKASDGTRYLLDRDVGLVTATDRYGNSVNYTSAGITSSLGPSLTFGRDPSGRITTITEPSGSLISYEYDAAGDLVAVTEQAGDVTTFAYENGHYLAVIDDAGPGPFRTLNYGPDGRLASITDAEGNTTEVSFDIDERTQVVTAPDGRSTRVTSFDERGNPVEVDEVYDGISHVTTFTHDANDKVTSRTDPLGNTFSATWDGRGNMTSVTDAEGHTTTYVYGAFDLPVRITDAAGATTNYQYDGTGNLVAVVHPAAATARSLASGGTERFAYDGRGNLITRTDALGNVWTWDYDTAARIESVNDPLGNTISYTYDAVGRMLTSADDTAATNSFEYDAVGNMTRHTDPLGRIARWTYDSRDQVVAEVDPSGATTTYTYDDAGELTSLTDPTGRTWGYTYAFGRIVSAVAPDGGVTTYSYDSAGRLATETDALGRALTYGYDLAGRWVSLSSPYGDGQVATTQYVLDGNGTEVATVDGRGNTWTYGRDELGRMSSSTNPVGETTTYAYDALGRLVEVGDPAGHTTTYAHDVAGQLRSITAADGGVWSYEYDAAGNEIASVDPLGRRTVIDYDAAYRPVRWVDPAGNVATTSYDAAGQVVAESTFAGVATTMSYDARGLLLSASDELGNATSYQYDAAGRLTREVDGRGNPTSYDYDATGRMRTITDALGGVVTYRYDLADQLLEVVDANGNERSYSYDDAGQLRTQTDALGRSWLFDYDATGGLVSSVDPRGAIIAYGYDAAGRLVGESSSAGQVTHSYDEAGRRSSMVDPTGTTIFEYDAVGRLTRVSAPAGALAYEYNTAGEQIRMTQPSGTVSYQYDTIGQLDSITDWTGASVSVDMDADGRILALQRSNGVTSSYGYDSAGRLTTLEHRAAGNLVAGYDYLLDASGNRDRLNIRTPSSSRVEDYTYDALNRLTAVDYGDGSGEAFVYDSAGNRTRRTATGGPSPVVTNYTYDAAQQLVTVSDGSGSHPRQHDAAGNLVNDGQGTSLSWDAYGRLRSVTAAGDVTSYSYDGDGLRTIADGAPQLWDRTEDHPRLVETPGEASYVHAGGTVVNQHAGGVLTWPLGDALGSVRVVTDGSGTVVGSSAYDAFGSVRDASGARPAFGFAGELTGAAGLSFLRARSYDPSAGRFISADTLQPNAAGTNGWNLYGYANGNPTTFVDPSGHSVAVEYGSLLRNSVITQTAIRALGLCIKGILEGVAFELLFAAALGYEYQFEWKWALVDCAIEIIFAGAGPPSPGKGGPPSPKPPKPKPDPPRPKDPGSPPKGGGTPNPPNPPKGPDTPKGPDGPKGPKGPGGPKGPDGPNGPKGPGGGPHGPKGPGGPKGPNPNKGPNPPNGFGGLSQAGKYGVQSYSSLRNQIKGTGLQAHHLLEQRFAGVLGQSPGSMSSVAVTQAEHQVFTNAWRQAIPYGAGTRNATPQQVMDAARNIYANYPAILRALGLGP